MSQAPAAPPSGPLRLDVVTIFPDYLRALNLSLVGKAADTGLIDLHVHDLREWTHDRHRTVDDTPLGGGAGMVMKPSWPRLRALRRKAVGSSSSPPPPETPSPNGPPRISPGPTRSSSHAAVTRA